MENKFKTYCVIGIKHPDFDVPEIYPVVPLSWIDQQNGTCPWFQTSEPTKKEKEEIIALRSPRSNLKLYRMKILSSTDDYMQAVRRSQRAANKDYLIETESEQKRVRKANPKFQDNFYSSPTKKRRNSNKQGNGDSAFVEDERCAVLKPIPNPNLFTNKPASGACQPRKLCVTAIEDSVVLPEVRVAMKINKMKATSSRSKSPSASNPKSSAASKPTPPLQSRSGVKPKINKTKNTTSECSQLDRPSLHIPPFTTEIKTPTKDDFTADGGLSSNSSTPKRDHHHREERWERLERLTECIPEKNMQIAICESEGGNTSLQSTNVSDQSEQENHHQPFSKDDGQLKVIVTLLVEIKRMVRSLDGRVANIERSMERAEINYSDQQNVLSKLASSVGEQEVVAVSTETSNIPNLPFTTIEEFEEFESKMVASRRFRKVFMEDMYRTPGEDGLKMGYAILKRIFNKNVSSQLVFNGFSLNKATQMPKKKFTEFKKTYLAVREAVFKRYTDTNPTQLEKKMGRFFAYSTDRESGREERRKKKETLAISQHSNSNSVITSSDAESESDV